MKQLVSFPLISLIGFAASCSSDARDDANHSALGAERVGSVSQALGATSTDGFGLYQVPLVLNQGPWGGRATAVSIDPSNAAHTLVASDTGGLFRTLDGGVSWTHLDNLIPSRFIDIRFSPHDANLVLAAGQGNTYLPSQGGIWRSLDGGVTWAKPATADPPCEVSPSAFDIEFAPDNNQDVYVGTSCGLAISHDAGASWTHISPTPAGNPSTAVSSVEAHPGGVIDILHRGGHQRSPNGGAYWPPVSPSTPAGLPLVFGYDRTPNVAAHSLAGSPYSPDVLFAANYPGVLFESDDGGQTWTNLGRPLDATGTPIPPPGNGRPVMVKTRPSIDGDPSHYDLYFGDTVQTYRLSCVNQQGLDCAGPFNRLNVDADPVPSGPWIGMEGPLSGHVDNSDIDWPTGDNCPAYLVGDGGIMTPDGCGDNSHWIVTAGLAAGVNALQIYTVTGQTLLDHTNYYFGTQDNNLYASIDDGASFNGFGNEGAYLQIPRHLDAATGEGQAVVTHGFWVQYDGSNFDGSSPRGAKCWVHPPNAPAGQVPYVVETGVYLEWGASTLYLTENTPPWLPLSDFIDTNGDSRPDTCVSCSEVLDTNGDGVPDFCVQDPPGMVWTAVAGIAVPNRVGRMQVVGPASDPTLYQAVKRADGTTGLVRIDGARSGSAVVVPIDTGLTDIGKGATEPTNVMFAVSDSNPDLILVADLGAGAMMVTRDGGANWQADPELTELVTNGGEFQFSGIFSGLNNNAVVNLPTTSVSTIAIDPNDGNRIVVGTEDAGLFVSLNGGDNWIALEGSRVMKSVSSAFFDERAEKVLLSSYGRGLWELTYPEVASCVHATQHLDIRDRAVVAAEATAGTLLEVGSNATLDGDGESGQNGLIRSNGVVTGDLTLAGTLSDQGAFTIGGTLVENDSPIIPTLPTKTFATGSGFQEVTGTTSLAPGNFGDVVLRPGASVTLNPGTYNFASLRVDVDVNLIVNGAVEINVQGAFEFGDRSDVIGGDALSVYSNGGFARIGTNATFNGVLIVPNADVTVASNTAIEGCIGAKNLTLDTDVNLDSVGKTLTTSAPLPDTCSDGIQNGYETGVDCGGPQCAPCPTGNVSAGLTVQTDWGAGYCANLAVTNESTLATTSWSVTLDLNGSLITGSWNGDFSGNSGVVTVGPGFSWNESIAAGQTNTSVGFCAERPQGAGTAVVTSASGSF